VICRIGFNLSDETRTCSGERTRGPRILQDVKLPLISSRTRYLLFGTALAVLAGAAYWVANWRWPAGSQSGTEFRGSAPAISALPRRFRVATFNIHSGYGLDGRFDLERTADCLKTADFIGLNEVGRGTKQDPRNQAERLGELLHVNWLFAPTELGWSGAQFGQAALTRVVVSHWQVVPFPRADGNGYRNYVECQIPLGSKILDPDRPASLTILFTHLDRKSDRQAQLQTLIRRFLELPPPVILMGDLNSKRTEPQLKDLIQQPGVTECFGKFAKEPLVSKRIDWIFTRGLKCLDANLEANQASDHPWGWADLELVDLKPVE
jgi:endonuclease/exonuclease/phosphatase family metal-dependent hydrolase